MTDVVFDSYMRSAGEPDYRALYEQQREIARGLAEALVKLKETCEYWIGAVDTRGMSESEYNTWLALGHHSKSMEMTRQALAKYNEQESSNEHD